MGGRPPGANDQPERGELSEEIDRMTEDSPSEDKLDDHYGDDEDYPIESSIGKGMWMRVRSSIKEQCEESNYRARAGGVSWDLLNRPKLDTKFPNGSIAHAN